MELLPFLRFALFSRFVLNPVNCDRELDVRCRVDNSKDGKLIRPVREERHEWTHSNVGTSTGRIRDVTV